LTQREYDATSKREVQLVIGQVKLPQTRDAAHLTAVHRIPFQDVYEWAGEYRTVNMEKGGRTFLDYRHLDEWLVQSSEQIGATQWSSLDHGQFAAAAAAATSSAMINKPIHSGRATGGRRGSFCSSAPAAVGSRWTSR